MEYCSKCEGKGGLCDYHLLIQFLKHINTNKFGEVKTEKTMMGYQNYLKRNGEEIRRKDSDKIDEIFIEIDQNLCASI